MIYHANSFNAELRWQSEDRAHRIGQTRSLTINDLVAPGTVDRRFLSSLREKRDLSDDVFRGDVAGKLKEFLS